jgi:hypothetical protein
MHFAARKICVCNYRILEVLASKILVQPVLEALEGSGKARGTMSNEGDSIPWVVHVERK